MARGWALLASLSAAALPVAAQAQSTSEALIAEQAKGLQSAIGSRRCREGGDGDPDGEIVVCGQTQSPYRLPLPVEPLPGAIVRGDVPSPVALTEEETCTNIGPTRGCPSFDILAIGLMIGKVVVEQVVREVTDD